MGKKLCIVQSKYNDQITGAILKNALIYLKREKFITVKIVKVEGSFEIPVMISRNIKNFDAFIAIGCIIKGQTLNFNLISTAITNGIMNLSINEKKPIGNAILTCFNKSQAKKRLNKGSEAAKAVIQILKNA
tara:strand:+ start:1062 stop:1457 length:396 start_codon:yes stop_codon:yes gene_type:complete